MRAEAPKLKPERTREVVRLRIWREWVVVSIFGGFWFWVSVSRSKGSCCMLEVKLSYIVLRGC